LEKSATKTTGESEKPAQNTEILRVKNLSVTYRTEKVDIRALHDVSFTLREREFVAIVGESGSGKSTLAFSIIGLLPPRAVIEGMLTFRDQNLATFDKKSWNRVRGKEIGMIFQEPLSSLNPISKVGNQMWETLQRNAGTRRSDVKYYDRSPSNLNMERNNGIPKLGWRKIPPRYREEIIYWLRLVRIPDPESILEKYPFELSGGMIQRVMIAMVLSQNPSLLLADEPTTALDVTTQAQILKLFLNLRNLTDASMLLVTHDLGVAAHVADRVIVMYAGEIVEDGTKEQVFMHPSHPYTQALIRCFPRGHKSKEELGTIAGTVPVLVSDIKGCRFAPRCAFASEVCRGEEVRYSEVEPKHYVKCTRYY
jgi:oligopeptide/dipeptide ABC transporter ATP-binding protein